MAKPTAPSAEIAGPMLSIKQVRAIDMASSHASLTQAAEQLNTSLSSLSRYVTEAERILGHRLFQRGWTGMEATSEGEVVIAHCRRMVSNIHAVQAKIAACGCHVADLGHYLTWEGLRSVDAVHVTGSASAAALYLGTSQPDVSRAIGKLSSAVGKPLFRRVRTGMAASEEARLLSDLQRDLRRDAALLPEQLRTLAGEVTGRVSVGLLPFSEQAVVVRAFGELFGRHRHVRLRAVTGSYAALIDALRQGELDFVLGVLRRPPPFEDLQEVRLYSESFAIVARSGHHLASGHPTVEELARENWMVAPHGTPSRSYFEDWLLQNGIIPPAQTCEIVTFFLAEQMILHSDAIGLLTYSDRQRAALQPGLHILSVDLPSNRREIGLTFRKHQHLSMAQQIFKDILLSEVRSGAATHRSSLP